MGIIRRSVVETCLQNRQQSREHHPFTKYHTTEEDDYVRYYPSIRELQEEDVLVRIFVADVAPVDRRSIYAGNRPRQITKDQSISTAKFRP